MVSFLKLNSFSHGRVWSGTMREPLQNLASDCVSERYFDLFTGCTIDAHPDGATRRLALAEVFARM